MKIAFWGEEKQSGTTSGMLAAAGMFSVMQPDMQVSVYNAAIPKGAKPCRLKECGMGQILSVDIADINFVDCGSGMDKIRYRILKQADLVVVNLRQEETSLKRFFLEESFLLPRRIVLLNNYSSHSKITPEYAERVYRADAGQFACLSCNSEFARAYDSGKIRRFIKRESREPGSERNRILLKELERFSNLLLRNMESVGGKMAAAGQGDLC